MENKYINVAKGLRLFRKARILAVISGIITLVGSTILIMGTSTRLGFTSQSGRDVLGSAVGAVSVSKVIMVLSLILGLVASVLEIVALVKNSVFHTRYKIALLLEAVNIVFTVITSVMSDSTIMKLIFIIVAFLMVYFVICGTIDILNEKGEVAVADEGADLRTFFIICTVIMVVGPLLLFIPILGILVSIIILLSALLQIIALFKFIGFLGRAATALEEQAEQF